MASNKNTISDSLLNIGETHFETKHHTVHIFDSCSGFEYNLYPLGSKCDDDGEFLNEPLDGGVFETISSIEAVENAFIESETYFEIHNQ